MSRHRLAREIVAVLSAVSLSGCHRMVPIITAPSPSQTAAAAFPEIEAGDKVRVTLQDGDRTMVVIAEVRADALIAKDGRRFDHAEIAEVEVKRFSKARTIALVAATPFLMLILVALTYHGE